MDWEPHDRHWIRLRGPWDVSWINEDGLPVDERRVPLPADWRALWGDRSGTARYVRRFQTPTLLGLSERVIVTVTNANADINCTINDVAVEPLAKPLGDPTCWPAADCRSFDVTPHLQSTNRLTLDVSVQQMPSDPFGLHEPVLLEIIDLDAIDDE